MNSASLNSKIKNFFTTVSLRYKYCFSDRKIAISIISAVILVTLSLILNFYAGTYATERASNPVTDIILSNIPVYDVDGTFIYGPFFFWIFIMIMLLSRPKEIPFTIKSIALFVLIRSVFISLTHIGPFPTRVEIDPTSFIRDFTFGADLFFSGHTGIPFLLSLIYWKNKLLRVLFIATSIFFGIIVLIAHLHYSIDVLSAFFITYTIYKISEKLLKKDHLLFLAN